MKHTPGPWRLVNDAQGPCMVMHPTLAGVAIANLGVCFNPVNGYHEDASAERSANARLIAAAPDLLAALKYCSAVCAGEIMNKNGLINALELARKALTKATGEPA